MADYIKPVVFKVGNELYGVDINLVQSIENQISIVPVPNSSKYIRGIVNLRNEVIPVYSLRKKFNADDSVVSDCAVIIHTSEYKIALEVDSVSEISDIAPENIVPMPFIVKNEETKFMDRVANVKGRLIVLMDVNELLTAEEKSDVEKLVEDMKQHEN